MPPWGRSLEYHLEPVIKQILRIKSIQIHEICLRSYMPNNIAIALQCHCEHMYIVSVPPFFYASQGFFLLVLHSTNLYTRDIHERNYLE